MGEGVLIITKELKTGRCVKVKHLIKPNFNYI